MTKEQIKEALQPIARGLFGKQGTNRYQRPEFKKYPLTVMMENLTAVSPVDWYPYVFSREPLNGKFTDAQRREWMEKAWDCGVEYAGKFRLKYGTGDPVVIAR